jgi:hypothetical protein
VEISAKQTNTGSGVEVSAEPTSATVIQQHEMRPFRVLPRPRHLVRGKAVAFTNSGKTARVSPVVVPSKSKSPNSLGAWLGNYVRQRMRENGAIEEQSRLRRVDSEVLTVEGLANLLHCCVAAARTISEDELPRRKGPGRRVLYLKKEAVRYLRLSQRVRPRADVLLAEIETEVLGAPVDSGRGVRRRRTHHE